MIALPSKTPEAVTSDEEGALSGEDSTRRPSKWSRRISGSFSRFTNANKDTSATKEIAPELKKEASPAPVEPVVAEAVTAVGTDEIAPVTESSEAPAETSGTSPHS
jgi:hypothetical protein